MASKLNIEEQFRQAILTASMSRYELAKRSGVSQGVLSNFVNRRRSLTLETAAKLAEVLELDIISRKDCGRKAR